MDEIVYSGNEVVFLRAQTVLHVQNSVQRAQVQGPIVMGELLGF